MAQQWVNGGWMESRPRKGTAGQKHGIGVRGESDGYMAHPLYPMHWVILFPMGLQQEQIQRFSSLVRQSDSYCDLGCM